MKQQKKLTVETKPILNKDLVDSVELFLDQVRTLLESHEGTGVLLVVSMKDEQDQDVYAGTIDGNTRLIQEMAGYFVQDFNNEARKLMQQKNKSGKVN